MAGPAETHLDPESTISFCNQLSGKRILVIPWPSDVRQMLGDKERATQSYSLVRQGASDAGDNADGVQMADQGGSGPLVLLRFLQKAA